MSIEDRITGSLRGALAALDGTPGDLGEVRRSGDRIRRRRRVVAGGAAAMVVALVAAGAMVIGGDDQSDVEPAPATGTWAALPSPPLSPRADSVTAWTGSEVLVVGGYTTVCPPTADCTQPNEMARDGAAYDPGTDTWREIADAPVELADYFRSVMVGDTLVLFDGRRSWFSYDVGDDAWRSLPGPAPGAVDTGSLTASKDGFVYTFAEDRSVWALNLAKRHWAQVPAGVDDRIDAQTVVATDDGFIVSGVRRHGADKGLVAADLWGYDDSLVQTGQLDPFRHWTGERLVELDLQVQSNDDGTTTPYGGALDPATGTWEPLPDQPKDSPDDDWSGPVAADGPLLAGWGYVYDDRDRSWTRLGRPADAVARLGTSAVWADGRLIVVGGADEKSNPTAQAWSWSPE